MEQGEEDGGEESRATLKSDAAVDAATAVASSERNALLLGWVRLALDPPADGAETAPREDGLQQGDAQPRGEGPLDRRNGESDRAVARGGGALKDGHTAAEGATSEAREGETCLQGARIHGATSEAREGARNGGETCPQRVRAHEATNKAREGKRKEERNTCPQRGRTHEATSEAREGARVEDETSRQRAGTREARREGTNKRQPEQNTPTPTPTQKHNKARRVGPSGTLVTPATSPREAVPRVWVGEGKAETRGTTGSPRVLTAGSGRVWFHIPSARLAKELPESWVAFSGVSGGILADVRVRW